MINDADARARMWLMRNLPPIAQATVALVAAVGPQEAMAQIKTGQAPKAVATEVLNRPRAEESADLAALDDGSCRFITPESAEWPTASLDALAKRGRGMPLGLWVSGAGSLTERLSRAVAVTATTQAT